MIKPFRMNGAPQTPMPGTRKSRHLRTITPQGQVVEGAGCAEVMA
jgi:hypothetical protein